MAGLASIENLALQEAEAERVRREREAAQLAADEAALAARRGRERAREAEGPAALLEELTGSRTAVAPEVQRNAEIDAFQNQQAARRYERQAARLAERKRDLAVEPPSAGARAREMAAPLGRFAAEDPAMVTQELERDRAGRIAALEQTKENLLRDVRGAETGTTPRPFLVGRGAADEPYFTNLTREELHDEYSTANDIREKAGMGPIRGPRNLERLDVGGTSLGPAKAATDSTAPAQQALDALLAQARRAPLDPRERAADLVQQQPLWDEQARALGPGGGIEEQLLAAIARGEVDPGTGATLGQRYRGMNRAAFDKSAGEYNSEVYSALLGHAPYGPPAPGQAARALATGGHAVPQAEAEKTAAVEEALQAPPDSPGATRSPALAAESGDPRDALLSAIQRPENRVPYGGSGGSIDLNAEPVEYGAPFIPPGMRERSAIPPWLADLPEDVRLVLEGLTQAAGGREHPEERRRRLAREAARRRG